MALFQKDFVKLLLKKQLISDRFALEENVSWQFINWGLGHELGVVFGLKFIVKFDFKIIDGIL